MTTDRSPKHTSNHPRESHSATPLPFPHPPKTYDRWPPQQQLAAALAASGTMEKAAPKPTKNQEFSIVFTDFLPPPLFPH